MWSTIRQKAEVKLFVTTQQFEGEGGYVDSFNNGCKLLEQEIKALLQLQSNEGRSQAAEDLPEGAFPIEPDAPASALAALLELSATPPSWVHEEEKINLNRPDMSGDSPLLMTLLAAVEKGHFESSVPLLIELILPSTGWARMPQALKARLLPQRSFPSYESTPRSSESNNQTTAFSGHLALHNIRSQIQQWATKSLAQKYSESSMAAIHQQVLSNAALNPGLYPPHQLSWSHVPLAPESPKCVRLAALLFHLSSSASAAWANIVRIFWHTLAMPMEGVEESGDRQHCPLETFPQRLSELKQQQQINIKKLVMGDMAVSSGRSSFTSTVSNLSQPSQVQSASFRPSARPSVAKTGPPSEAQLLEVGRAIMPATHLQMVGQKLLYHAVRQLPCLTDLPLRVPDEVIASLYADPFAEALRTTVFTLIDNPGTDMSPFISGRGIDRTPISLPGTVSEEGTSLAQPSLSLRHSLSGSHSASNQTLEHSESKISSTRSMSFVQLQWGLRRNLSLQLAGSNMTAVHQIFRDMANFEAGFLEAVAACPRAGEGCRAPQVLQAALNSVLEELREPLGMYITDTLTGEAQHIVEEFKEVVAMEISSAYWPEYTSGTKSARPSSSYAAGGSPPSGMSPSSSLANIIGATADRPFVSTSPRSRPQLIDECSLRIIEMACHNLKMGILPDEVKCLVIQSVLEVLEGLMDTLGCSAVPLRYTAHQERPVPIMLLHLSAAELLLHQLNEVGAYVQQLSVKTASTAMVNTFAAALLQAHDLITSLRRHIVLAAVHTASTSILSATDAADWGSFRPPMLDQHSASPGARVLRLMLARTIHHILRIASEETATLLISQILQEVMHISAMRYATISPSSQRVPQYVADILHITETIYMCSQPHISPIGTEQTEPSKSEGSRHRRKSQSHGHVQRSVSVPEPAAAALAEHCFSLLARAALLSCTPTQLEQHMQVVWRNNYTHHLSTAPPVAATSSLPKPEPSAPRPSQAAARAAPTEGPSMSPLYSAPQGASPALGTLRTPGARSPYSSADGRPSPTKLPPLPRPELRPKEGEKQQLLEFPKLGMMPEPQITSDQGAQESEAKAQITAGHRKDANDISFTPRRVVSQSGTAAPTESQQSQLPSSSVPGPTPYVPPKSESYHKPSTTEQTPVIPRECLSDPADYTNTPSKSGTDPNKASEGNQRKNEGFGPGSQVPFPDRTSPGIDNGSPFFHFTHMSLPESTASVDFLPNTVPAVGPTGGYLRPPRPPSGLSAQSMSDRLHPTAIGQTLLGGPRTTSHAQGMSSCPPPASDRQSTPSRPPSAASGQGMSGRPPLPPPLTGAEKNGPPATFHLPPEALFSLPEPLISSSGVEPEISGLASVPSLEFGAVPLGSPIGESVEMTALPAASFSSYQLTSTLLHSTRNAEGPPGSRPVAEGTENQVMWSYNMAFSEFESSKLVADHRDGIQSAERNSAAAVYSSLNAQERSYSTISQPIAEGTEEANIPSPGLSFAIPKSSEPAVDLIGGKQTAEQSAAIAAGSRSPSGPWLWLGSTLCTALRRDIWPAQIAFNPQQYLDIGAQSPLEQEFEVEWRAVLGRVAEGVSRQEALDALASRHELQAEVEGLPYSVEERAQRDQVRKLAREYGITTT